MRVLAWTLILFGSMALPACGGNSRSGGNPGSPNSSRKNVVEVDPSTLPSAAQAGQTLYVPVYSSIAVSDSPHLFNLAISLSVRNTDRKNSIFVKSVAYHDHDGGLVMEHLSKPLKVGPLASADFFIRESDKAGGLSSSFIVDWIADRPISPPVVEAVMIGTANTQGVSFRSEGRVLHDLAGNPSK